MSLMLQDATARTGTILLTVLVGTLAAAKPAAAQPYVYVQGATNNAPQHVTVIDTATNAKVARVTAGRASAGSASGPNLAISRDGASLFLANVLDSTVSVISTATNTIIHTLPEAVVGFEPTGLVVSPDNTRLYVARSGSGLVHEVDIATRSRTRTVGLGVTGIGGMEVAPDGSRLYVSNDSSHSIKVVDTATFGVSATIPFGSGTYPGKLAVSPDGLRLYVALFANNVAVIDTTSGTVVATINVGQSPTSIAISPIEAFAYVPVIDNVSGSDTVVRLSTTTNTVLATVPNVRGGDIAFTADGAFAWVVGTDRVYSISTATNSVVGSPIPLTLAVDGVGREVVTTPPPFTPPLAITTTTLPPATRGAAYSANLAATGGTGAVTWSLLSGALPSGLTLSPSGTIAGTPAAPGTAHFTVRAIDAASMVATRALSIVVSEPAGNPAPVLGPGIVNRPNVTLNWTPPTTGPAPTAYTIVASLSPGGPLIAQLPVGAQTSFTVAAPDGSFFVRVVATVNGAPVTSNEIRVDVAPPALPSSPLNLTAAVAGDVITFAWQAPNGVVTGYVLEAGTAPGLSNLAVLPLGNAMTFVTPPVPNGNYYVRIRAQNTTGTGPASNEVRVVVGPPPPSAPALTGSSGPGGTVTLSWTVPSSGAPVTGYQLLAGSVAGASDIAVIELPATQTTLVAASVPAGTYYVRMRAASASGPGMDSNEITLIVP